MNWKRCVRKPLKSCPMWSKAFMTSGRSEGRQTTRTSDRRQGNLAETNSAPAAAVASINAVAGQTKQHLCGPAYFLSDRSLSICGSSASPSRPPTNSPSFVCARKPVWPREQVHTLHAALWIGSRSTSDPPLSSEIVTLWRGPAGLPSILRFEYLRSVCGQIYANYSPNGWDSRALGRQLTPLSLGSLLGRENHDANHSGGPPPVVIGHAGNGRDALSKAILTAPEHARVDNAWFCSFQSVVHQRRVKSPAAPFYSPRHSPWVN